MCVCHVDVCGCRAGVEKSVSARTVDVLVYALAVSACAGDVLVYDGAVRAGKKPCRCAPVPCV